jgi:hypothetical protein
MAILLVYILMGMSSQEVARLVKWNAEYRKQLKSEIYAASKKKWWATVDRAALPKTSLDTYRERLRTRVVMVDSGCLEWTRGRFDSGYGAFYFQGRTIQAHRVVWFLEYGHWPSEFLCHWCNNPPCAKISHLFEGTPKQNSEHMVACGRSATGLKNGRYTEGLGPSRDNILEICSKHAAGVTQQALADEYGISRTAIYRVLSGQAWVHKMGAA